MKFKALIKKVIKFNPNEVSNASGGFRVWLDFAEQYEKQAVELFELQGKEIVFDVEINFEDK